MPNTLNDPVYKTYVAQKLREQHPELQSAEDDEVLQVVRKVEIPSASDEEWGQVLNKMYPDAPTTKTDYTKFLPGVVAAGAIGIGAGLLGSFAKRVPTFKPIEKMTPSIEKAPTAIEKIMSVPTEEMTDVLKEKSAQIGGEGISKMPKETPPPKEPREPGPPKFKPSSRALHQMDPINVHAMKKIESNPEYLQRLSDSGGGKTIGHTQVWTEAFNRSPMSINELSQWKPDQPASTVDVARANILRTYWWDQFIESIKNEDQPRVNEIESILNKIEPGYNNLTATPGRALEFQKVVQFSKEVSDKVSELKAINAPMSQVKAEVEKLLQEQEKQLDENTKTKFFNVLSQVEDYATAAKLTSPVTHAVNTISNGLTFTQRGLEKMVEAAGLLATGKPNEAESVFKYAWGTQNGLIDATRKFMEEMQSKEFTGGKGERTNKRVPPPKFTQPVFKLLSAADSFWKSIIEDSELHTKAFDQASKEEGLRGDALSRRIIELVENPPKSWKEAAEIVAKEYTFQEDPGRVLKAVQAIQHIPGGRFILPFVTTPYNILSFYNRRSIFGGLSPRFYREINAGGRRRIIALSRLGTGLGITAGTLSLLNLGQITGAYPSNPKERAVWTAEGKRPWSIKIGNYWVQYNRLQPIGLYLMTVAAIRSSIEDNNFQKAENKFGKALGQLLKGPLDLPFLQGMSSVFDVINDPERSWQKLLQLTATGFIPNILRDVRQQLDPNQRQPQNVSDAIKNMIPGLSTQVPAKISVLGKEVKGEPSHILRATKMIGQTTEDEKTKLMNEIGWAPPTPKSTFTSKLTGEDIELKGDQKQQFLIDMGQAAEEAMTKVMEHKEFSSLTKDQKKMVLQRVTEKMQEAVRKKYQALSGVYGEKGIEKIQGIIQKTEGGQ